MQAAGRSPGRRSTVSPVRRPRTLLTAGLTAFLVGLTACGGAGDETAGPGETTTAVTNEPTTDPTTPNTGANRPPRRPPGPPGPIIPDDLHNAVQRWFRLLEAGFASGRCQPLLDQIGRDLRSLGRGSAKGGAAYAALFRGAGNGCLGRVATARGELQQARVLLRALAPGGEFDETCRAHELLVWAFEVYLGQRIPLDCVPATTTSTSSTTTSRVTTTRATTTTTRR